MALLLFGCAASGLLLIGMIVASGRSSRTRGGRVELAAIRESDYDNMKQPIYRTIDHLAGWKLDWALGGDAPKTDINKDRLDEVTADAARIASYLQVDEFPPDMRKAIDPSMDPCDDFYQFACGHWAESKGSQIPNDASSVALQWDQVDDGIRAQLKTLFETDKESPAAIFYRSCLKGTAPKASWDLLTPWMEMTESITDNVTFVDAAIKVQLADLSLFWTWSVDIDSWNKERYGLFLKGSRPILDADEYTQYLATGKESDTISAFKEFVKNLVGLAGYDDNVALDDAEKVLRMDMKLAAGFNSSDDSSHYDQWIDREYLSIKAPSIDWERWFEGMNFSQVGVGEEGEEEDAMGQPLSSPRLIMKQGGWLQNLEDIFSCKDFTSSNGTVDTEGCWGEVESYARFRLIYNYATYLDDSFRDAVHDWHNAKYGVTAKQQRVKKCYSDTTYLLGWASSYLYVENVFPKTRKDDTITMLKNIRQEFRDSLETTKWMDPASRKAAQEKLDNMFFEVGYPDDWPESVFRNIGQLSEDNYVGNVDIIGSNAVKRAQTRIFESPQRNRWGESYPIVVNAFYSPMVNGLWVPAGIIQTPFYSETYDDARNYGALGTICGHEMTHGFDDTGHLLDKNGDQKDWWDSKTFKEFDQRADCLAEQYSEYGSEVPDWYQGNHVDGEATLGENIADEGGMRFAFQAFEKSHPTQRRSMSAHRLFFTAFAQNWCESDTQDVAIDSLFSDEHSPAKYRVLGVLSNFQPFARAFQCPVGTAMNPKKQCQLW